MAPELVERINGSWNQARRGRRIGLSDFSHGRKWREELEDAGVMEIIDRGDTAGWLVSDEGMGSMLDYIGLLEKELESAQIEVMYKSRAEHAQWMDGEELAEAAKSSLIGRETALRGAAHVD